MSLITENVIPGNHGKIFATDAQSTKDLLRIKKEILAIDGVKDVMLQEDVFPREFTIHTHSLVKITAIQKRVNAIGFHVVSKSLFGLA